MEAKQKSSWEIERDKQNALIDSKIEKLGLSYEATFVPQSQSRNKGKDHCLNWNISISKDRNVTLTTDYAQGIAHIPNYNQLNSKKYDGFYKESCESGKYATRYNLDFGGRLYGKDFKKLPAPLLRDVLYSLVRDSEVLDYDSFELWASDFGYDTDSIKANNIYQDCLQIALKLRAMFGDAAMSLLKEMFQDY